MGPYWRKKLISLQGFTRQQNQGESALPWPLETCQGGNDRHQSGEDMTGNGRPAPCQCVQCVSTFSICLFTLQPSHTNVGLFNTISPSPPRIIKTTDRANASPLCIDLLDRIEILFPFSLCALWGDVQAWMMCNVWPAHCMYIFFTMFTVSRTFQLNYTYSDGSIRGNI